MKMSRFGVCSLSTIDKKVKGNVPINTEKAKKTVWNQFTTFCTEREYTLSAETSEAQLANIMKDYAYNMKKMDGEDYKEVVMLKLGRWKTPVGFFRWYHEHRVTDNIQFITIHNDKITVDPKTLHIHRRISKPICVQLDWMSAAAALSRRYSRLLLDDLDVVVVRCDVRHVLQPESGVQRIALDLLRLMSVNDATYVVFGLSIGSYLWSEALVHAARDTQYQPVLDRVSAQIWDSIANLKRTPTGIPLAVFPNLVKNKRVFQWVTYVIDSWYKFYLKSCYTSVTAHYERAAHTFLHTACRAPALVLQAENDIISPWQYARRIHDVWTESGIKTTWKCWEKSNHVSSYLYHPQEYKTLVRTHIQQNLPGLTISD